MLADNTDLPGAVAAVRERYDGPVTAGTVLGGGATAASTGAGAVRARRPDRARCWCATRSVRRRRWPRCARHPSRPRVEVGSLADDPVRGRGRGVDGAGLGAGRPTLVGRCAGVPGGLRGALRPVADAAGRGAPTPGRVLVGGLDLLVHQAALQFALFTGRPAPLEAMRRAGERALAGR